MQALWRARALRYVLIYLLMGSALVTLRYQTREVYPQLSALRETRTELQRQQKELSLKVQSLTGEQRVRDWALAHGMMPYAQATKQTRAFGPSVAPPTNSSGTDTSGTDTSGTDTSSANSSSTVQPVSPSSQRPDPGPALSPLTVRTVWR